MTNTRTTVSLAVLAILAGCISVAHAQTDTGVAATTRIAIPAGDLTAALESLVRQTGIQLLYDLKIVEGLRTRGAQGQLTTEQAIAKLLEGTSLELHADPSGALLISLPTSGDGRGEDGARSQNVVELEEILVTGTHIRGPATNAAAAVTVYDRAQLERLGITTAGEILRILPQNQGTGSTNPYNTLGSSRFANLRGLGEGTTLVLVNGQRTVSSAISLNTLNGAAQFNLDVLPSAAIERIEILRDGASAIYGADAVGGVINVILRSGYEGAEVTARYQTVTSGDVTEQSYSGVFGKQLGNVSVLVGGEYYDRDPLLGGARPYSAYRDKTPYGGTVVVPASVGAAPVPANISAVPGGGNLPGLTSTTAAAPGGAVRSLQPSDFASRQGQSNPLLDITSLLTMLSPQERYSGFGRLQLPIGDAWSVNLDAMYSRSETSSANETVLNNRPFAAANPNNPFGVNTLVSFYLLGLRAGAATEAEDYSVSTGVEGRLAGDWRIRGNVYFGESQLDQLEWNTDTAKVDAALASSNPATALNPLFNGQGNSPALLKSLFTTSLRGKVKSRAQGVVTGFTGPVLELPAGKVDVALGGESRREALDLDSLNAISGVRRVIDEDRDLNAAYVELGIPLLRGDDSSGPAALDLSLAARYEDYSDFGDTTNPKVGLRWRPLAGLTVRGTWSTAFQAPSLSQLYSVGTQFNGSASAAIFDPVLNQTYTLSGTIRILGNENLEPQEADTLSAGFNYEHALGRGTWNASVDYYRIDFTDRIRSPATNAEVIGLESLFPQFVSRDPTTRRITDLVRAPINMAGVKTAGIDFSVGYALPWLGGSFDVSLNGTVVDKYELQVSPTSPVLDRKAFVGFSNKLKSNLQLLYSSSAWSAAAVVYYADAYRSDVQPGREIVSQTTADLQFSYECCGSRAAAWLENLKLTVGVINVFDREPPFYNSLLGFDPGEGDALQRRVYAKLSAAF